MDSSSPNPSRDPEPELVDAKPRSMAGKLAAAIGVALSALYLLNPTMGVFELLPDNIPGLGNLDEAFFTALLIGSLRYLGIDLLRWRKK